MCANSLLDNEIFMNAAGAAAGGFLGVLLLLIIKWIVEHVGSRPKLIITYQCASDINRGQKNEVEGELKHHHGKRVHDETELARLGVNHPVWEWTRTPTGDNNGNGGSVFYGPYTTDFPEPGLYSIIFRIRGIGFTKPEEVTNDVNLLKLDANYIVPQMVGINQGVVVAGKHEEAAVRFVRVSNLAQNGWQEFELKVWSDGRGKWEYRAWAFDGKGSPHNNFERLSPDVRIVFDTVAIRRISKFRLPEV